MIASTVDLSEEWNALRDNVCRAKDPSPPSPEYKKFCNAVKDRTKQAITKLYKDWEQGHPGLKDEKSVGCLLMDVWKTVKNEGEEGTERMSINKWSVVRLIKEVWNAGAENNSQKEAALEWWDEMSVEWAPGGFSIAMQDFMIDTEDLMEL